MKIIMNQNQNLLEFICHECQKKYFIDYESVQTIPLWKYENCSRACAEEYSKNKFLTLKSKKEKPNSTHNI